MSVIEKMNQIASLIGEIKQEDENAGNLLAEGFLLSAKLMQEITEAGNRDKIDISEHLAMIGRVFGFTVEDLVKFVLQNNFQSVESDKEPDPATLEFITSDLDDYEKFLAQNKAKEDLDFLSKEI
jgi:hypothetical protein